MKASDKKNAPEKIESVDIKPFDYGTADTKRAITNIVSQVTKSYKFTSLPELNAILNLYNVTADRGTKESVMFKNGGLHYWIIDKIGRKTGVPIKASSIYNKPTLKLLEDRFRLNEFLRKPFKEKLKAKIDRVRLKVISLEQFKSGLKKIDVSAIVRQNSEGRIYGVSYIDHVNKAIFNGSDLGKNYSAAAIVEALQYKPTGNLPASIDKVWTKTAATPDHDQIFAGKQAHGLLEELLNPLDANESLPHQFGLKKKKKKKRKKLNL